MIEDFVEGAAVQTRLLYACPNVKTSHRLVPLNVPTPTFQRAPGHATGTFALESALDELAVQLRIDPVELRLRNEPGEDPEKKLPWSSRSLRQCYETGAAAFGWRTRTPQPRSMHEGGELVGWGYATATYPANRSRAAAIARLLPDGTVVVQCGTQDLGTGMYTVMAQIAADVLGLPIERVRSELGDSRFPEAPVSGGSQSTASVAPAVEAAAMALRDKLIALAVADQASPVFRAAVGDVVVEAGGVGLKSARRREPLAEALARNGGREIVATGTADPGDAKKHHSLHSFGAVFAEVRVDPDLGVIRVPRVVGRYSIGRLLNAKTGRSQLLGGVVWGIGMALMEESVLDSRSGRFVNANLADYHVPTNADIGTIDVDVVPENDPYIDSLGARGIGEIGITGVAAALANAVFHATGVRVRSLPITLDKLVV
jgi:xanthine dehydrogenase YagR molybdenum-binding subunit